MAPFLTFLFSLFLSAALLAEPAVDLHVPAAVLGAPGNMRVRISIQPDEKNRWGCFGWVQIDGAAAKSSCWSIEGSAEAKTIYKNVVDLPAGDYELSAWVVQNDASIKRSILRTLRVIGPRFD
jgi:hypothetical protein